MVGVLVIGSIYVLNYGLYPRYFDIEWVEEVRLHDGRLIEVQMKRTYERIGLADRWHAVHRDTEIGFDTRNGRFSKKFQRYDIDFLHEKNGVWYIYLLTTAGTPPEKLVDWSAAFLILDQEGRLKKASSWDELPPGFSTRNIMPPSPDAKRIFQFHNTKLREEEKMQHWKAFPTAAGDDGVLRRPKKNQN